MRLCRFEGNRLGLVTGGVIRDVTAALDVLPAVRYPFPCHDVLIANLPRVMERVRAIADTAPALPVESVTLSSPVANPGKIIAAPLNYQKHSAEVRADSQIHHHNPANTASIDTMGVFLKAASSLVGPGEGVALRMPERRTDHEVELAFVIGKTADRVSREDAKQYIAGYAVGLDITIRGPEDRSLRKSPDSYTVLGPWLVTADEVADPDDLDLSLEVNGERRQDSNTRYMIKSVGALVEMASAFYTLHPGDIVLTGTPEGVSPIEPGDVVVARIQGIGGMTVSVRAISGTEEPTAASSAVGRA